MRLAHASSLLCALAWSAACGDTEPASLDLDEDPDDLREFEGKSDGHACDDFPGGDKSGDELLILVNKSLEQQLASDWAPTDLVQLDRSIMMPGRTGLLRFGVAEALAELVDDAATDGLELGVRSGYRSFETQCITFAFKVEQHGLEHAKRFSAEPGRSQHQLGTTVDITSPRLGWSLEQSMGLEPEGLWLAANAHRFGFALSYPEDVESITGYGYEPWHFRYIGRAAASEMHDRHVILEQYLDACAAPMSNLDCPTEELAVPVANRGWIGGACASDADCESIGGNAFCLLGEDGYSEGYCTLPCTEFCPDRAGYNSTTFCTDTSVGGMCHSQCDESLYGPSGCREGYSCQDATRPSGSKDSRVCLPL